MDNLVKINYQTELDGITRTLEEQGRVPSILLHSCCGPCSSYVVTYLRQWFDVTVLYYNPNIYPQEEYEHRLREQARLLKELQVPLLTVPYDHREFLDVAAGLEAEPEGGARCSRCFVLRLRRTMELAQEQGFDYFATTLTVSPHKNAMVINRIGQALAGEMSGDAADEILEKTEDAGCMEPFFGKAAKGARETTGPLWLPSDFKKKDGYKKSIQLSKQYDLYRQEYCGCEFAMGHLEHGPEKSE